MNAEQLMGFCSPTRSKLCKPFSFGEYTYATNGHVMLRLPRMPDVPQWDASNEKAEKLFSQIDIPALTSKLIKIPAFGKSKSEPCKSCDGTGKLSKCPECSGSGDVKLDSDYSTYWLDSDYSTYWCECKTCDGSGAVAGCEEICGECNGMKKEKSAKPIAVGSAHFQEHYLILLKTLPGIKIAPTDKNSAAYLKFDDGDGLLMPIRV